MNKNDLVAAVAEATNMSKADTARTVDGVFDAISGALKAGDEITLWCITWVSAPDTAVPDMTGLPFKESGGRHAAQVQPCPASQV